MRLLQAMGGSSHGGAENFFMRLAPQLDLHVSQEIFMRGRGKRIEELRQEGLKVQQGSFGGAFDLKTRLQFFRKIRHFKPDLVLTWMNRATFLCPSSQMFRKFLPSFIHVARLGGFYNLKYYKDCDALIGNTKGVVAYLKKKGWPSEKVFYLPNFVDLPDLSAVSPFCRKLYEISEDVPVILAAGRLHPNKAFDTLIRAMVFLKEASLWILGEGPQEKYLKDLARDLGVLERVRFFGWQENMGPFYRAATLFVCPSRHEPLGNVILEAWAQGCPVIAASAEGPRELIEPGTTGLLFPIDDIPALVSCLKELLRTESLQSLFQKEGRKAIEKNFSKEKIVDGYVACFSSLLKKKKGL